MRKGSKTRLLSVSVTIWASLFSAALATPPTRYPVEVIQTGRTNTQTNGPVYWGHRTEYALKVLDNEGDAFGLGDVWEAFGACYVSSDPVIGPEMRRLGVPGTASHWGVVSVFTDTNATYVSWDTGGGTWWYTFDQVWHDTYNGHNYTLNTHSVQHYQSGVVRNY